MSEVEKVPVKHTVLVRMGRPGYVADFYTLTQNPILISSVAQNVILDLFPPLL